MPDTDVQHLERLRSYWKRHHGFPSMAKLCGVVGLSSTASVFDLVSRLKDAGYVQRVEGRIAPSKRFFARPLVGAVRAGLPQPRQEEDDFEVLTLDDYLVPDPNRTFLARVKGDSIRDVALVDGDLVVVQKNCPTKVGDILNIEPKYLMDYSCETAFREDHRRLAPGAQADRALGFALSVGASRYWHGFTHGQHRSFEVLATGLKDAAPSGPKKGRSPVSAENGRPPR